MSEGSDEDLVRRVLRGDRAAYDPLVQRYTRMAWAIAFGILRNAADAEDAAQDALVRAYQRLAECRDPARFAQWLARIARNTAFNKRKYLQVRATSPLDHGGGDTDAFAAHAPRADTLVEISEMRDRLNAALATLRERDREIVLLHDLEGYSHTQIAALHGISEITSRKALSRARSALRALLKTEDTP